MQNFNNKVQKALDKVRPHLQADGGDVEIVEADEKTGVVKVKLVGVCHSCPMASITLSEGIAKVLKKEVKEVKSVEAV